MKKILILTSSRLEGLMNKERLEIYKELEIKDKGYIIYIDKFTTEGLSEKINFMKKDIFSIILEEPCWHKKLDINPFKYECIRNLKLRKTVIVSDFFIDSDYFQWFLKWAKIDFVASNHQTSINFISKIKDIKEIFYLPFSIRKEDYKEKITKDIDILYTSRSEPVTPLRNRIAKVLEKNFTVTNLDHPGKRLEKSSKKIHGSSYIEYLKRSKFVITCTTKYKISLRKYWEIYAAGAIAIGDLTEYPEHDIFRKNIVLITEDLSDQKIIEKVRQNLEEYEKRYKGINTISNKLINDLSTENIAETLYKKLIYLSRIHDQPFFKLKKIHRNAKLSDFKFLVKKFLEVNFRFIK